MMMMMQTNLINNKSSNYLVKKSPGAYIT